MTNLFRSLVALALLAAAPVASAGFSTTNLQLLQGFNYDDKVYGIQDADQTIVTLNQFSTWEYGDSFFFADFARTRFGDVDSSSVYVEWHPRLFLNEVLGQKEPLFGIFKNWGLAGEVNQGNGFNAYLAGFGVDFVAPQGWVLGCNAFYRYDSGAYHQWQVSPYWTVPFALGKVPFLFTGFIDVNGTKKGLGTADEANAVEIWAQPQLLVDALAPFGGKAGRLYVGVEYAYHLGYAGFGSDTESSTTQIPQAMVQWTVF